MVSVEAVVEKMSCVSPWRSASARGARGENARQWR